ncbi:MAG: TIGR04282 family arsenosugar biosynthesis glycosyltransferase [Cyclobacteriaceae bacterium]
MRELLIIFVKNPVLGKVKTRLAKDIGNEKALEVYKKLLQHTHDVTDSLSVTKRVYYSDVIDENDLWANDKFEKFQQSGADLGERMHNAFQQGFADGFDHICIIGSDCFEINSEIIEMAFSKLKTHDFVIGPAKDGGYYMLGMKSLHKSLFENKEWSTDKVLKETLTDIERLGKRFWKLAELNDVDRVGDI